MLIVRRISKSLGTLAIKDASFEVQQGQYFVLLGPSGAGKSVLLETIVGLIRPDAGKVLLNGKDITYKKIQKRKIGMVFQNSTLFPHMTIYDNIAYPLRCKKLSQFQIRERVAELAKDFAITNLLDHRPQTLSGGESQRASLARAVASEPRCLLLDEPISSLDVKSRPQIRSLLRKINARGQTIVHVTHDYTEAVSLGTHIAVMENGRIAQTGTAKQIFCHPKSEFIARFIGIRNFFKGWLKETEGKQEYERRFTNGSMAFSVLTDRPAGPGYIMVRSEDVIIGNTASRTSARNNFEGTIVDITSAGVGIEVVVDIGTKVAALITNESVKKLGLRCGKKVWVSFKASAIKYVEQ